MVISMPKRNSTATGVSHFIRNLLDGYGAHIHLMGIMPSMTLRTRLNRVVQEGLFEVFGQKLGTGRALLYSNWKSGTSFPA